MDALQEWTGLVAPALGVDPGLVGATQDDVLDMVRDVAHGVLRPAAPLTAYVVGLAAGRAGAEGGDVAAAVRDALAQVEALLSARGPAGG
ncbi:putative molybdopterin-guanine dinucleotide biosynthesis protein MobA [Cellulomonas flavigena DSM 20109]|uniref:Putative molybdopterin-guanine dinucleotide biosynthesis protein MobA n=1 Tax=Cellulomonas flavigena (strain ATCC 482 / DSM 20109 / BCRC 11376 / JCM 18109 / NBRC 3775 / NCIMB 8073 / NRS 134) TaxID=446466 RepID=D5UEI4_CELFN|nr:DUF6457 domain-containing protein [Cellulomonas flavigena]ADG74644.1 putative molybdopterin-guanine dinucleotide biosynthesis protein MobA [Cellulomonas flavigena DSM 20109]